MAVLSAMAVNPERVKERFYTKEENKAGIYLMSFIVNGKETPVYVDNYFPYGCYGPVCNFFNDKNLWVRLLEKGWAKLNGTYARLIGGRTQIVTEYLLGVAYRSFYHANSMENTDKIW